MYLQLGSTKTSISLVRDQHKSGRDCSLTEKLQLHSLLQDDRVPQAAAAGKTIGNAAMQQAINICWKLPSQTGLSIGIKKKRRNNPQTKLIMTMHMSGIKN